MQRICSCSPRWTRCGSEGVDSLAACILVVLVDTGGGGNDDMCWVGSTSSEATNAGLNLFVEILY